MMQLTGSMSSQKSLRLILIRGVNSFLPLKIFFRGIHSRLRISSWLYIQWIKWSLKIGFKYSSYLKKSFATFFMINLFFAVIRKMRKLTLSKNMANLQNKKIIIYLYPKVWLQWTHNIKLLQEFNLIKN
jgi:hypothetical protein